MLHRILFNRMLETIDEAILSEEDGILQGFDDFAEYKFHAGVRVALLTFRDRLEYELKYVEQNALKLEEEWHNIQRPQNVEITNPQVGDSSLSRSKSPIKQAVLSFLTKLKMSKSTE